MTATLVKKTSKKNNKEYICIEIQVTDSYKKVVFLDEPESELVKLAYKNL